MPFFLNQVSCGATFRRRAVPIKATAGMPHRGNMGVASGSAEWNSASAGRPRDGMRRFYNPTC